VSKDKNIYQLEEFINFYLVTQMLLIKVIYGREELNSNKEIKVQ